MIVLHVLGYCVESVPQNVCLFTLGDDIWTSETLQLENSASFVTSEVWQITTNILSFLVWENLAYTGINCF